MHVLMLLPKMKSFNLRYIKIFMDVIVLNLKNSDLKAKMRLNLHSVIAPYSEFGQSRALLMSALNLGTELTTAITIMMIFLTSVKFYLLNPVILSHLNGLVK